MIISARIDVATTRHGSRSYPKHPRWPSSSSIIELADLIKLGKTWAKRTGAGVYGACAAGRRSSWFRRLWTI